MSTPPKVMIADDNVPLLTSLAVRLRTEGYEVLCVQDAYQAVEQARKFCPDVLLLDIGMPAGNGFTVQERIAKVEQFANLPVVYLTGMRSPKISATAKRLGAFALLHKPCDSEVLVETVRQALISTRELESSGTH